MKEARLTDAIYTIGHSNQSFDSFLSLLCAHQITAIADVRSYPYSSANPQFDRESFADALHAQDIAYVFLGKELGARTKDSTCYVDGKVQYELLAKTKLFQEGLSRLELGMQRFRVALMCAEAEPLVCHRTILIARRLRDMQIPVKHILRGATVEDHDQSMERLLRTLEMNNHDMFRDHAALVSEAYRLQAERIAYEPPSEDEKKQCLSAAHKTR